MSEHTFATHSTSSDWTSARQQMAFRQIMNCFAYPGRIASLDTESGHALPLLLATLVDREVSLADPLKLLDDDVRRRLATRSATPDQAEFIILPGQYPPDFQPNLGSLENPEQAATLILVADNLGTGATLQLSGPGIPDIAMISVAGIDPLWWHKRTSWNAAFPLGVDIIIVAGRQVLGLPRTTHINMKGAC